MRRTIDVFRELCWCSVYCFEPAVHSVRQLAERLNISKYQARKYIHRLKLWGLVKRGCDGGMDEDGNIWCCHGWSLTANGKETKIYKEIYKEEVHFIDNLIHEVNE